MCRFYQIKIDRGLPTSFRCIIGAVLSVGLLNCQPSTSKQMTKEEKALINWPQQKADSTLLATEASIEVSSMFNANMILLRTCENSLTENSTEAQKPIVAHIQHILSEQDSLKQIR